MGWLYQQSGQTKPEAIEETEIAALLDADKIDGETPVWCEGMAAWAPMRETELNRFLPYASPVSDIPPSPASRHKMRSLGGLATWLKRLLWFNLVSSILLLPIDLFFDDLTGATSSISGPTDPISLIIMTGIGLMSLAILAVLIATVVVWCIWIIRAAKNVRALGAEGLNFSPGWCAGWYFVPIAWFVMPFLAHAEVHRASIKPNDWRSVHTPIMVQLWWGACAGILLLSWIEVLLTIGMEHSIILSALSSSFEVIAAFLAIKVVHELTFSQSVRAAGAS